MSFRDEEVGVGGQLGSEGEKVVGGRRGEERGGGRGRQGREGVDELDASHKLIFRSLYRPESSSKPTP